MNPLPEALPVPDDPRLQIGETPLTRRILAHLDALDLPYERLEHEPVTTSKAAARARASPLREGAKAHAVGRQSACRVGA